MVKPLLKENKDLTSKNFSNTPKCGFIQKKKNQKFKQTPTGKVSLINGSKVSNNNSMENNTLQKMDKKLKQKDIKKQEESTKKQLKKKNSIEAEENESDLDDINEGIVLQNSTMENSDETQSSDDSESEEERTLPNILGTSLADESDDDDEDYEDDEKIQTKKGLKMFDGVKSNKSTDFIDDTEDFITDDSDDKDDADSDDDSDDDSYEDSSYDEEDEELGEGEEDEESKSEEENEESRSAEENEESESEEEANESLGLKVLLGNSIADDDDDDDDFVEPSDNDEDDDISDEEDEESEEEKVEKNNSINNSDVEHSYLEDLKKDKRTIFVNNLPKNVTKKKVEKLFNKFGKIDTIRLRGKIPKSLNISKRTAAITNDLHSKLKTIYAFVKFESEESVKKALSLNGKIFEGNYLEVRASHKSDNEYDPKKAVFIGNLHFSK